MRQIVHGGRGNGMEEVLDRRLFLSLLVSIL